MERSQVGNAGRYALPFLGAACAVGVGSIYYNQPLLLVMGKSFHQSARAMGFVAVATQVGYASGILCFVPLGDMTDRRKLMMRMYGCVSVALLIAAFAQNLATSICASILIGMMAAVTHIVLPMAPEFVSHERRGQAIGTVMTGLLLGVLLARTFAGWVSSLFGWRSVFLIAAVINLAFVPLIYRMMPNVARQQGLTYGDAMRSLWTLFRGEPLLRESGMIGGLSFAAFSCFWTTLTFVIAKYYGLGPGVAGAFGLVGAAGATIAPFAGRLADKRGTRHVVTLAVALLTLSYAFIGGSVRLHAATAIHLGLLVVGVLTLDVGAQMLQVGNQTRIFGLGETVRSRINTLYMTMYFVGGAAGSALATLVWSRWEWNGVCGLELVLMAAAGLAHVTGYSRTHETPAARLADGEIEIA